MRFTMLLLLLTGALVCLIGAGVSYSGGYRHEVTDQVAISVYIVGAFVCLGLAGVMAGIEKLIAQREPKPTGAIAATTEAK